MLSSIIYETVDLVYTIGRVSIRSIKTVYSWFSKKNKETSEQLRVRLLEERISELEEQRLTVRPI